MTRVIEINTCKDCPYYSETCDECYCNSHRLREDVRNKVSDNCPLPLKEEATWAVEEIFPRSISKQKSVLFKSQAIVKKKDRSNYVKIGMCRTLDGAIAFIRDRAINIEDVSDEVL